MQKRPLKYTVDGEILYQIKLKDALEELLADKVNYKLVKTTAFCQSTNGKIYNIIDGSIYHNHSVFC
jgi:hypothetical protein